ncbi:sugar ABC transporter ATP-binding protein [Paraburkholderia sp. USG1]|uniref:sugar ABC transporter ATP-binding protein n=1 Tax=Paraburkholderia sp. USG1 TaxID=2952268 RepID=UPI00285B5E18|nr:sugar ABC transporter ATP-binding protein [Paraburkholderia sp. USG1]MDR8398410.1 sugar ABC transporter ATP-binding protein [Paraburkholderia sp. USG1]
MEPSALSGLADSQPLLEFVGIGKTFGKVKALSQISFAFMRGECVGIAGHNGAGKSTLMSVLAGVYEPSEGRIVIDGKPLSRYDANAARLAGVRCVFQELSLCANLGIAENMCVVHPRLGGRGWRRRAAALMREMLGEIFPGNGLSGDELVSDLTLTQRQMVEIARAFTVTDVPVRLVILDEPTSSLDARTAGQLLAFIRKAAHSGITCLLVTHMLGEMERASDRVMVMRDGVLVDVLVHGNLTRSAIIQAMGQQREVRNDPVEARTRKDRATQTGYMWTVGTGQPSRIDASRGEVVGFAGLAGHGQTDALLAIYADSTRRGSGRARVAFVAGDRGRDGVFPLWSIAQNLDLRWLLGGMNRPSRRSAVVAWLVDFARARSLVDLWRTRVGIRGASMSSGILSLSGGNQQKVLFARALASDADLILMDDPTRGVDVGTKEEIYQLVHEEASRGRTFIWYTTENDELQYCDRTFVFHSGHVTRVLHLDEYSEEALLSASFEEHAA